jgi:hypothetical protein
MENKKKEANMHYIYHSSSTRSPADEEKNIESGVPKKEEPDTHPDNIPGKHNPVRPQDPNVEP